MWLSKYDDDRMILVTADLVMPRVFTSSLSTLWFIGVFDTNMAERVLLLDIHTPFYAQLS
jgi:hypothetical protein